MTAERVPPGSASSRVAIVLPDLRAGGAERVALHLAAQWSSDGFPVDLVLLRARGELLAAVPAAVEVVDLRVERLRSAVGPLARYLRRRSPAAVLASMWPVTVVAVVAARVARASSRVVVSDHELLSAGYAGYGRWHRLLLRGTMAVAYRIADERIAVSKGVARDLAAVSGMPVERFRVVYNPVAHGAAPSGSPPDELAHVRGPLLLSVGALKPVKDQALLVDAFALLPRELGATLCILGEGDARAALERRVAERGLSGRVLLPGFRRETAPWYRRADLFVLSSRHEGFGNVIVEALEQGVPVVSTDCPSGPREILCDGTYGRLVPPGDAERLADAMREALSAAHDRAALRRRARDFAVDKIAREYLDVMLPEWRSCCREAVA